MLSQLACIALDDALHRASMAVSLGESVLMARHNTTLVPQGAHHAIESKAECASFIAPYANCATIKADASCCLHAIHRHVDRTLRLHGNNLITGRSADENIARLRRALVGDAVVVFWLGRPVSGQLGRNCATCKCQRNVSPRERGAAARNTDTRSSGLCKIS